MKQLIKSLICRLLYGKPLRGEKITEPPTVSHIYPDGYIENPNFKEMNFWYQHISKTK